MNNNTDVDAYYIVTNYRLRKEKDFFLIFMPETGQYYTLNDTGRLILEMLEESLTIKQICLNLHYRYSVDLEDIKKCLADYIYQLELNCIIRKDVNNKDTEKKKFEIPAITLIEKTYNKGKQCQTFGMPKRSCKSLPSGVYTMGRNPQWYKE